VSAAANERNEPTAGAGDARENAADDVIERNEPTADAGHVRESAADGVIVQNEPTEGAGIAAQTFAEVAPMGPTVPPAPSGGA
jgi:hypothetical protein